MNAKIVQSFILLMTVTLLCNCSVARKEIVSGVFCDIKNKNLNGQTLVINEDHSFRYEICPDLVGKLSYSGTWHLRHRTLLLIPAADIRLPELDTLVESSTALLISKIKVLNAADSSNVVGAEVIINGNDRIFVDSLGDAIIPTKYVKTIRIKFLTLADKTFDVNKASTNMFTAYVKFHSPPPLFQTIPIAKWKVKGQKLVSALQKSREFIPTELVKCQ